MRIFMYGRSIVTGCPDIPAPDGIVGRSGGLVPDPVTFESWSVRIGKRPDRHSTLPREATSIAMHFKRVEHLKLAG